MFLKILLCNCCTPPPTNYTSQNCILSQSGASLVMLSCRHRSVLFKAVADRLPAGCSVPARLVRGNYGYDSADGGAHAWNVVRWVTTWADGLGMNEPNRACRATERWSGQSSLHLWWDMPDALLCNC